MKIGIIGYDIFGTGGTKRSNLNLIEELQLAGSDIAFFNLLPFDKKKIINLKKENIFLENIQFYSITDFTKLKEFEKFIITRESLFIYGRIIKKINSKAKIIGEVHTPIDLLDPDLDLAKDVIDVYRVATEAIQKRFCQYIGQENVVCFPVSTKHVHFSNKVNIPNSNEQINFLIYARFDERQKNISYAIRLIEYLIRVHDRKNFYLYINGNGAGEKLYADLIKMYRLEDSVFINRQIPNKFISLSTANFETLGYSILEFFSEGLPTVLYRGDDDSLWDIYGELNSICWLDKDIINDSKKILSFVDSQFKQVKDFFKKDSDTLQKKLVSNNYGWQYIDNVINFPVVLPTPPEDFNIEKIMIEIQNTNNIQDSSFLVMMYQKFKNIPFIGQIVKSNNLKNWVRKSIGILKKGSIKNNKNSILDRKNLNSDIVFVESFHGKSFAGDPKYLAKSIAKKYPKKKIYVSSTNELVDMEILNNGFIPLRLGGNYYISKFQNAKWIILNGNSLDKVGKSSNQLFIQTWHGFPLKRMVSDLEDEKQRREETEAFVPRMKKWDYLLSSSVKCTQLFNSAFSLEENKNLKILEYGMPRNEYLLKYQYDDTEKERIILKYFNRPWAKDKKYILYCPTWRKKKRNKLNNIDLKKVVSLLPDNYEMIVKLHPLESNLKKKYQNLDPRIHCFDNEITDIQELFIISNILITDYSSAMFDFAHLNRKTIVFQDDSIEYKNSIGWYFDISKETGLFPQAYSEKELAEKILDEDFGDYNDLIVNKFMSNDSINSSSKIIATVSKK